ncbi:4-hydroxybenzoate polyprenyltransferase, mitochondrial [Odontomachus brunneus]|uniref:4-hydroxybenzoate polyprenyltransferase, mitochondrial n=1 Tax=Odontomachus brunneus TaxID=486640 RepID=UPI0013F1B19A|nr:4-hydroxybenzoate polyprenyltransferase, mitochondrial [Odontomachus brunneus]
MMLVVRRYHRLTAVGSLSCKVYPEFMLLDSLAFNYMQNRSYAEVCSVVQDKFKPKVNLSERRTTNLLRTSDILTCIKLVDLQQKRYLGLAAKLVNNASPKVQPYMKLIRMDKPIGSWLLFWPCGWSIAMATPAGTLPDPYMLLLFGIGSFVMRGAGCIINDLWDRDIDKMVVRTKDRPLAIGQITMKQSIIFLAGQLSLGLFILLQLNWYSVFLGASSLGLVVIYPLMKRVTYWPQLILGMTFNWGALLGWSAIHGSCDWSICMPMYIGGVCWTIVYDTIYAHQDRSDDILLGMKSTAIKFGDDTKFYLSGFAIAMIACLVNSGILAAQTWPYYTTVGLVAAHIGNQIYFLNINNPTDCAKRFISNHKVGMILFTGIILGNLMKKSMKKEIKD